jgi:RNA polymerase sigma factor (sigma-70 family)
MISEKEFITIINEHEHIIHKVCNLYMHTKDDQQDLFQEIILNAWKGIKQFRKESKFSTWLYRVALNTAITMFKKERKHSELKKTPYDHHPVEYPNEHDQQYLAMIKAVQQLTDIEKALVMLYFEDYTHDEIAAVLGTTANNVAVKMNRVKAKLRERSKHFID